MPRTQTYCPRCRQPIVADIEQLFDVSADPQAKNRFLSGSFNAARCNSCGFEGPLSTPLVYHDADKELLLTYFPPELGLPVNEQERMVGPMITQVVNRLPNDKRKAYLFRPQTMLTLQTMVEKVLEGEGITREMIDGQQKRLNLIQRLISTKPESREEVVKQEEALIDESFFGILTQLAQAVLSQGDENTARALLLLQQELLKSTPVGQKLAERVQEEQAAVKQLQEAGNSLTRDKLMDMLINAPTETRVNALVSMTRNGLDYTFFQMLSERIEQAEGDEKTRLAALRERLLHITSQIDQAVQREIAEARKVLETILQAPDIEAAVAQNMEAVTDFFLEALNSEITEARKNANLERIAKLQAVNNVIEKASAPPPEYALIEKLMEADDDDSRLRILQENEPLVTQEFINTLSALAQQGESQGQPPEVVERFRAAYLVALRFNMQKNLQK